MKTLIIDNYDSFTYNLYQLVAAINGLSPLVVRNDELTWQQFVDLHPDNVIISPGPGRPENERDFGICRQIVLDAQIPVLGVCLGLQGIGYLFGGCVVRAPEPVHGRTSAIHHDGQGLFEGIPQGFQAVRYHSLILSRPVPDCLRITAWDADNIVMGVEHRARPIYAVQFHPESICTEHGEALVRNFIRLTRASSNLNQPPPFSLLSQGEEIPRHPRTGKHSWKVFSRKLDVYPSAEDTFVALFGNDCPAFWLDSSDGDASRSRFSFMGGLGGAGPVKASDQNLFDFLERELLERYCDSEELPFDFNGGFVGYIGYECGTDRIHHSPYPESGLTFADRFLAFDHHEREVYLVYAGLAHEADAANTWLDSMERRVRGGIPVAPPPPSRNETMSFGLEQDRTEYLATIEECRQLIADGESYEICLTNRLTATTTVDPLDYYRVLRRLNPAPYSAFLRFQGVSVACSSPERFLRIDRTHSVESRPIKGTVRRSANPEEDYHLRETLRTSIKTRSENLMIVDLLRNDLGQVCEIGSVGVPQMMEVETYTNLHQLVSTVRGRLHKDASVIDCLRSTFPGGSMTGAPKIRTMELIDRLERSARGIYSGTIGFFGLNGTADLNIVIRTAVFSDNRVSIGIGGAIVALSEPEAEFDEAILKGQALVEAFRSLAATSMA